VASEEAALEGEKAAMEAMPDGPEKDAARAHMEEASEALEAKREAVQVPANEDTAEDHLVQDANHRNGPASAGDESLAVDSATGLDDKIGSTSAAHEPEIVQNPTDPEDSAVVDAMGADQPGDAAHEHIDTPTAEVEVVDNPIEQEVSAVAEAMGAELSEAVDAEAEQWIIGAEAAPVGNASDAVLAAVGTSQGAAEAAKLAQQVSAEASNRVDAMPAGEEKDITILEMAEIEEKAQVAAAESARLAGIVQEAKNKLDTVIDDTMLDGAVPDDDIDQAAVDALALKFAGSLSDDDSDEDEDDFLNARDDDDPEVKEMRQRMLSGSSSLSFKKPSSFLMP